MLRSTASKTCLAMFLAFPCLSAQAEESVIESLPMNFEEATDPNATLDVGDVERDVGERISLIQRLALVNASEVKLGSIILERAKTKAERAYAKALIVDHLQVFDQLRDLVDQKGVKFSTEKLVDVAMKLKDLQETELDDLRTTKAEEFKSALMEKSKIRHLRTLAVLKAISEQREDPEMKRLAQVVFYTIKKHQRMAEFL